MIPVFSNSLGDEELAAVGEVMKSRWLGMGKQCEALEAELAEHFGVERVLLLNCATNGIYLALRCLGLQPGQEVIIPTIHFVACAGAVLEAGAVPVFVDVDPQTLNIIPRQIEQNRTSRTVGVILNHYGGHPAEMDKIRDASHGLWILEDAANAPASTYHGRAVGTLGDAGIWSFDAMKVMSMADGGALWFKDDDHHERAWRLRNLGLDTLSGASKAAEDGGRWWEFRVPEPSGRSDSNDLLACIGRAQLRKLPEMVLERHLIWRLYQSALKGIGDLQLPPEPLDDCRSSYYLYWVQTAQRDRLARYLYENGVYTTFRYYPLHWAFGYESAYVPYAEQAANVTLNIPIHQNLNSDELKLIVKLIREFYSE